MAKPLSGWQRKPPHSRDVLLRLVELLLQVAGRGLAGDFHHGQLLVVAGHVARRPAHAAAALHGRQFGFGRQGEERRGGEKGDGDDSQLCCIYKVVQGAKV